MKLGKFAEVEQLGHFHYRLIQLLKPSCKFSLQSELVHCFSIPLIRILDGDVDVTDESQSQ